MTEQLLDALAVDLARGFPCLVETHQDLVYGICRRMTGSPSDAEELTQDVFLRAHAALLRYPRQRIEELRIRGWLARIAVNLSRNHRRKRAATNGTLDTATSLAVMDRWEQPERVALEREETAAWAERLARLPEHLRVAVELRHVEGLPYPEVADALGRPIGTVKAQVHRGVRLLRAAYDAEEATDRHRIKELQEATK